MTAPQVAGSGEKRDRLDIVVTSLFALAAVATAWSSYQANRWNGEQSKQSGTTNALRIDAARAGPRSGRDASRRGDVHPVGRRLCGG